MYLINDVELFPGLYLTRKKNTLPCFGRQPFFLNGQHTSIFDKKLPMKKIPNFHTQEKCVGTHSPLNY